MDLIEAVENRHSVRSYTPDAIPQDVADQLEDSIRTYNTEADLHIQLVLNEPRAFSSSMARYGKFTGVQNYFAMVGRKDSFLDEKIGYYGERLVLQAQMLGLNTCWVALTFSKSVAKSHIQINPGEKLVCVIALGYGQTQGVERKTKPMDELCEPEGKPEWFIRGMRAAMVAPTAVNQQKFHIDLEGEKPIFISLGGFYSYVDLGIVICNFEVGAQRKVIKPWEEG